MKKLLLTIIFLPVLALAQTRPIMMGDTNKPNVFKPSGIVVDTNNNQVTVPGSLVLTNGTLDLQGATGFKLANGAGSGKVLTSDGSGNAAWSNTSSSASTVWGVMTNNLNAVKSWTTLVTAATTTTNGTTSIFGQALLVSSNSTIWTHGYARLLKVVGSTTNVIAYNYHGQSGQTFGDTLFVQARDTITTNTTYVLQGAAALNAGGGDPGPAGEVVWSVNQASYYDTPAQANFDSKPVSNATSIIIHQFPQ